MAQSKTEDVKREIRESPTSDRPARPVARTPGTEEETRRRRERAETLRRMNRQRKMK